jgi:hypothetical protein
MKLTSYRPILFTFIIALTLVLFLSMRQDISPQRSQNQKIFDDFVEEMRLIQKETTTSELNQDELLLRPNFNLELRQKTKESEQILEFNLDWLNREKAAKGIRILELLSLANIFSSKNSYPKTDMNSLRIRTSAAVQFDYSFSTKELEMNQSLALALVIIKDSATPITVQK